MRPASRREARERIISLLYEAEAKNLDLPTVTAEQPVALDGYVVEALAGIAERAGSIDGLIARYARDWTLGRMPAVDRCVLRLAVYELLVRTDVPVGAVISEAVELAKQYSTEDSGRFVNGLLASVAAEVRPQDGLEGRLPDGPPDGPPHGPPGDNV